MNKSKIIAAAQKFLQKGQFSKAIKEYLKIVAEDANDIRTWLKIADLYSKSGDLVNATETYRKVADYYAKQGFYLKAVAVNKQILKIDPNLVDVHIELANLYKQLGLLGDAIAQYQSVIAQLEYQGRRVESIEVFRKMLELDPDNITGRIKLAESYSKEGMVDDAIREFAIACDFLKENGRINDYIKVAERLIYHQPTNLELAKELAQLYLERNDPKRALAKLQLCFKEAPKDEIVLAMLADAFNALGQSQKTIPVLKELIKVYKEKGRQTEVTETYRVILDIDPSDKSALRELGEPPEIESRPAVLPSVKSGPPASSPVPGPPPSSRTPTPVATSTPMPGPAPSSRTPPPGHGTSYSPAQPEPDSMSLEAEIMSLDVDALSSEGGEAVSEEEFSIDIDGSVELSGQFIDVPPGTDIPSRGNTQEIFSEIDQLESEELVEEVMDLEDLEVVEDAAQLVPPASLDGEIGDMADPAAREKQLKKLLTEVEIYIKLNLHEKALQHLNRVFEIDGENLEALAYTKEIYEYLGYQDKVVEVLIRLSELVSEQDQTLARDFLEEAIQLDPNNREVLNRLAVTRPDIHLPTSKPKPPPVSLAPSIKYTNEDEEYIDGRLDEIGFFLESGLDEEAAMMFRELQSRYPVHPKVVAKAAEIPQI